MKRKVKPTRDKKGRIRNWRGGEKGDSWHSTRVKIGKEFKRQKGRTAKVGDLVRRKNKDGSYNTGSPWYVKTRYGWRSVKKAPKQKRR